MKTWPKISTDRILSLSAICIGLITFLVYLYQSALMTEQKHASVWPYFEWIRGFNEKDGFYIEVINKGIGPALVNNETIKSNNQNMQGVNDLNIQQFGTDNIDYAYSTVYNPVLMPGEQIKRLQIYDLEKAAIADSLLKVQNFTYTLTYCSIHKECWESNGLRVFSK